MIGCATGGTDGRFLFRRQQVLAVAAVREKSRLCTAAPASDRRGRGRGQQVERRIHVGEKIWGPRGVSGRFPEYIIVAWPVRSRHEPHGKKAPEERTFVRMLAARGLPSLPRLDNR